MTGDTNVKEDIFVRDRTTAVTTRVSVASAGTQGTSLSYQPAISDDGRYVTFETASNVVADTDTNASFDIYVQDRTTGALASQSFDFMGNAAGVSIEAAISSDGGRGPATANQPVWPHLPPLGETDRQRRRGRLCRHIGWCAGSPYSR